MDEVLQWMIICGIAYWGILMFLWGLLRATEMIILFAPGVLIVCCVADLILSNNDYASYQPEAFQPIKPLSIIIPWLLVTFTSLAIGMFLRMSFARRRTSSSTA